MLSARQAVNIIDVDNDNAEQQKQSTPLSIHDMPLKNNIHFHTPYNCHQLSFQTSSLGEVWDVGRCRWRQLFRLLLLDLRATDGRG